MLQNSMHGIQNHMRTYNLEDILPLVNPKAFLTSSCEDFFPLMRVPCATPTMYEYGYRRGVALAEHRKKHSGSLFSYYTAECSFYLPASTEHIVGKPLNPRKNISKVELSKTVQTKMDGLCQLYGEVTRQQTPRMKTMDHSSSAPIYFLTQMSSKARQQFTNNIQDELSSG